MKLLVLTDGRDLGRVRRNGPRRGKARPLVVAAAVALAGCNANRGLDVAVQTTAPGVVAGPYFPNYNPYNPIQYAQTSGVYGGR